FGSGEKHRLIYALGDEVTGLTAGAWEDTKVRPAHIIRWKGRQPSPTRLRPLHQHFRLPDPRRDQAHPGCRNTPRVDTKVGKYRLTVGHGLPRCSVTGARRSHPAGHP